MGDATAQLLAAISERDEVGVLLALENGANANFSGRLGGRPLHTAAYDRDSEDVMIMMDHLLKHNAEINAQNKQGFTPLMVASLNGHENIVRMLLQYDADTEIIRGTTGERALHLAMNKNGSGIATALLDAGADMNAQTSEDNTTPLHLAANFGNSLSAEALIKHPTFEREILQARNKAGETPAKVATREGHHNLARRLHFAEAYETNIDKQMITALLSGKVEDLESALNNGADVNKPTSKYVTPLHVAAAKGSLSLVQVLLKRHADVEALDNDGYTPLMVASLRGYIDVVEKLIAFRAETNNESYEGETALHLAVIHDNRPVVRSLLNNGASINKRTKDGSTPLHLAAKYNAIGSAEELVKDRSCNKDERNANGHTPFEIARKRGHRQLCSVLNVEDEADADVYELQFQEVIKPRVTYGEIKEPSLKIYKNTSRPRGKVLIINNIKFEGKNFRHGAQSDTIYLNDLFEQMGYKVQVQEDLTRTQTLKVLEDFSHEEDLKDIDSVLFFFLSHGMEGKFLTLDGKYLEESEVQEFFKNEKCPHLKGKPKVFVFNFCRGEFVENRTKVHLQTDTDSKAIGHTDEKGMAPSEKSKDDKNKTTDAPKDMLSIYASTDGIKVLRHPTLGTFFIKILCQIFATFAHRYDILDMTEIICNQMEREYLTTPETRHYHFKKFFLNPVLLKAGDMAKDTELFIAQNNNKE